MAWSDAARAAALEARRQLKAQGLTRIGYIGGGGGVKLTDVVESRSTYAARLLKAREELRAAGREPWRAPRVANHDALNTAYGRIGRVMDAKGVVRKADSLHAAAAAASVAHMTIIHGYKK